MDNRLREFEELMLGNVLFKVQNHTLVDKNPKWKKWWQIVQEITHEQIQDNLEMVHANEDAYLNKLVTYWLKFEGYTYDWLSTKLVEILAEISQRILPMQPTFALLSSRFELVTNTTKEPIPIRGGVKITTVSYTFFMPTKLVEVCVVVVSTHVEELEEHVTPKLVPSAIPQIGVGVEITLINIITHRHGVEGHTC